MKRYGAWSPEENKLYLEAIKEFKSWAQVSQHVKTRSPGQCRSHDQKMKDKSGREKLKCPSGNRSKQSRPKKDAATQWEPPSISYYAQLDSQKNSKIFTSTTSASTDFTDISSAESFYSRFELDLSSDSVKNSLGIFD
jgi:hypothetical protein